MIKNKQERMNYYLDICRKADPDDETHPLENISDEEKVEVTMLAATDMIFFINLIRVSSPIGYTHLFPYEKQKKIIETFLADHYLIINGSRQTGKSTIILAIALWCMNFVKNFQVTITRQKDENVVESITEFWDMYNSLPTWLREKAVVDNQKRKEFANGSKIKGVVVDPKDPEKAGRGMKADMVIIDEAGFIRGISEAYDALEPACNKRHLMIQKSGKNIPYGIVIISTPNGKVGIGKWYYVQWTKALRGETKFKPIKFHWTEVPEYNEEWYKQVTRGKSERYINQEYELVFLGAENAFLPDNLINKLSKNKKPPIEERPLFVGRLKLFKEISDNTFYIIGADPADTGADYSAMVVFDYFSNEVCAIYYNNVVTTDTFIDDVIACASLFKNSIVVFERNGVGASGPERILKALGRHRIYTHDRKKRTLKDIEKYVGLRNTGVTRKHVIDCIYYGCVNFYDKIYSEELIDELTSLEIKGSRVEAPSDLHDDLAIAYGFCMYAFLHGHLEDYLYYFDINKKDIVENKKMIEKIMNFNIKSREFKESQIDDFYNETDNNTNYENEILRIITKKYNHEKETKEILNNIFKRPLT